MPLSHEGWELAGDPGLRLYVYTAEPGSNSQHALDLLASWVATLDQQEQHEQRLGSP